MRKRNEQLARVAGLALLTVACGDPTGMDAGTDGGMDAGADSGLDSGTDAGPEPTFYIRVVHDIPGMTGTTEEPGGAHLCTWISNEGAVIPSTRQFLTRPTGPIPFRGVSSYVPFPVVAPIDYVLGVYEPAALDAMGDCPLDPTDPAAPAAVLLATITADQVPADSFSSAIAAGLVPDSLGSVGGALPSLCNEVSPPSPPELTSLCPDTLATELRVVRDDRSPPSAGMARIRISHQIPNAPFVLNVCYDPGLVPMPDGSCADATAGADDQATLFAAVPYGTITDYVERAPIAPTTPMGGGGLYLSPEIGTGGCLAFDSPFIGSNRCYPMLPAFPPMPEPLPDEIRPQLEPDAITTLFLSGALGLDGSDAATFGATFFLWQDNYVAP